MEPVYIPHIAQAPRGTVKLEFREMLPQMTTLTPVQGTISIRHGGTFLEVNAQAHTIMTLTCDRTLVQFNHRLAIDVSEFIYLRSESGHLPKERELEPEDLNETLPPTGHFNVAGWLYEQMCLALPYPQIAPDAPASVNVQCEGVAVDRRWAALTAFQIAPTDS
ncbi:MAG: DUF177 domain-containing protein [Oscillatoriales cyanobacterium SM2_2_1]|nr:DUF177 domain-containing protein [Oscillatoriales cyanobacterium SM2_2_1]